MHALSKNWGWLLGLGILMVILGVVAIGAPVAATFAVEVLIGWILIIAGIGQVIQAFMAKGWQGFLFALLSGLLYLLVGLLILAEPLRGALALTVLLAVFLLVEGVFKIVTALRTRPLNGWLWLLLSGVVTVILGGLIWSEWPASGMVVIGLLIGIQLLLNGWSLVLIALAARVASPATT